MIAGNNIGMELVMRLVPDDQGNIIIKGDVRRLALWKGWHTTHIYRILSGDRM